MLSFLRKRVPTGPAAAELLAQAQERHADGRFVEGVELARRALERRERELGVDDASLLPYLLTYAGLLYLTAGWASGLPFYDRAQRLRGARRSERPGVRSSTDAPPARASALLLAVVLLASIAVTGCSGARAASPPAIPDAGVEGEPHPFVCD